MTKKSKRPSVAGDPDRADTPAGIKAELDRRYPRDLHKELWGREDRKLEDTLYRWWWEFLSASRAFPEYLAELKQEPVAGTENAAKLAAMEQDFGDLDTDFIAWWRAAGASLFQEQEVPKIKVLKPDLPSDGAFLEKHGVLLQVPMTISRELILEQINLMLDIYHPGPALKRHEHSTAKRKIYPKTRYRDVDYSQLLSFWRAQRENLRTEHPAPLWRVYCQYANDDNLLKQLEDPDNMDARIKLGKQAEQLLKQANEIMRNAVLGEFPNDMNYQATKHGAKA